MTKSPLISHVPESRAVYRLSGPLSHEGETRLRKLGFSLKAAEPPLKALLIVNGHRLSFERANRYVKIRLKSLLNDPERFRQDILFLAALGVGISLDQSRSTIALETDLPKGIKFVPRRGTSVRASQLCLQRCDWSNYWCAVSLAEEPAVELG